MNRAWLPNTITARLESGCSTWPGSTSRFADALVGERRRATEEMR